MQFIQTRPEYVQQFKDVRTAYMLGCLEDRYRSSKQRPQFNDQNGTYIIYTIDQLMNDVCIGRNLAIKMLKRIESAGYIVKKQQFNRATKLYMPIYEQELNAQSSESLESNHPQVSKSNSNQSNQAKTNTTSDTSHTRTADFKFDPVSMYLETTCGKTKISKQAITKVLKQTAYNVSKARKLVAVILKAKQYVAKRHKLANTDPVTRFESNTSINAKLDTKLAVIFSNWGNAKNQLAYMMTSLKEFFTDCFGLNPVKRVNPSVKQPTQSYEPAWLNHQQATKSEPVDEARKAALLARIHLMHAESAQ